MRKEIWIGKLQPYLDMKTLASETLNEVMIKTHTCSRLVTLEILIADWTS